MKLVATSAPVALLVCASLAAAQPAKPAPAKPAPAKASGEAPVGEASKPAAKAPTAAPPKAAPPAKPEPAPAAKAAPGPLEERVVPPPAIQEPLPPPDEEVELEEESESNDETASDAPLARKAYADQHAKEHGGPGRGKPIDISPPPPPPEPEPPEPPGFGDYQQHFTLGIGLRLNWFADEAYNQFSDKPLLGQFTLGGGYVFPLGGAFSVAAKLGWDFGGRSSTLRGLPTALDVHRITLGPSLRYHFHRRLFVSAGVMPGVRHSIASLQDSGVAYSGAQTAFSMDLLLGAEFQVLGKPRNDAGFPRWWVGIEGGYSIGTQSAVVLEPGEDAPARTESLALDPVELGGGLLRLTTSITY